MGLNISKSTYERFVSALNSFSTSVINSVSKTTNIQDVINQTITVRIERGATLNCKDFNINQILDLNVKRVIFMDDTQKNDISNQLINKIESEISRILNQTNEGLNIGQANVSEDVTRLMTNIRNQLDINIKNSIDEYTLDKIDTSQNITFIVSDNSQVNSDNCNINQNSVIQSITESISKSVQDTIVNNDVANELADKYDLKVTQKNEGLNLNIIVIAAIAIALIMLVMFFSGSSWIAVLLVLLLVIIGGGVGWYFFKGKLGL